MSDKSFRDRIREEALEFPDIYSDFYEDFKSRAAEHKVENIWHDLFAVPFNGLVLDEPKKEAARKKLNVKHKHQAVLEAIKELGLHELRLGPLSFENREDYLKVSAVLDTGLLTTDDIAPASGGKGFKQFDGLAERIKSDPSDPIFWRSLLEIFCRALVAKRGRKPWPLQRTIELAFDLDEIRQTLPGRRWDRDAVLEALKEAPYRAKYLTANSKASSEEVGPDRIQNIVDAIGPMDDDAIFVRLRSYFPHTFEKVWNARIQNDVLHKHGIDNIIKWSEIEGDPADNDPPNDEPHSERGV